jgi:hypothetical protein
MNRSPQDQVRRCPMPVSVEPCRSALTRKRSLGQAQYRPRCSRRSQAWPSQDGRAFERSWQHGGSRIGPDLAPSGGGKRHDTSALDTCPSSRHRRDRPMPAKELIARSAPAVSGLFGLPRSLCPQLLRGIPHASSPTVKQGIKERSDDRERVIQGCRRFQQ